jgi:hypothetical protein
VDVLSIKNGMGHSDLQTTQRYIHARQASEQVERFARAIEGLGLSGCVNSALLHRRETRA